jgi:hypothetical protein
MRFIATLQTCVALLVAFLLAPFQHVHSGPDHDHSELIHAHFYHFHATELHASENPVDQFQGMQLADFDDDDHADAHSLDTFTIELPSALAPFVLPRGPVFAFVPSETLQPVEVVEERGHDPPATDRSIPRAPPA